MVRIEHVYVYQQNPFWLAKDNRFPGHPLFYIKAKHAIFWQPKFSCTIGLTQWRHVNIIYMVTWILIMSIKSVATETLSTIAASEDPKTERQDSLRAGCNFDGISILGRCGSHILFCFSYVIEKLRQTLPHTKFIVLNVL